MHGVLNELPGISYECTYDCMKLLSNGKETVAIKKNCSDQFDQQKWFKVD